MVTLNELQDLDLWISLDMAATSYAQLDAEWEAAEAAAELEALRAS